MPPCEIWLIRHAETEWSKAGKHTGRTDIPLTDDGRAHAATLPERLGGQTFDAVFVSPLSRARETARLAGLGDQAQLRDELLEYDYGDYEGITTDEIREQVPDWTVWTHPCPGGETVEGVATRLDRVVARCRETDGDVLLVGHGHALRALGARWLDLPVREGRLLKLDTGTVSVLGHEREQAVLLHWNS